MRLCLFAAALAVGVTGAGGGFARAVEADEIGKAEDAIVTPADRALIEAKCGAASGARRSSTNFQGGALICDDGRRVDDAETRAMSARISERADAYVARVMNQRSVREAMDGTIQRRTAAALRRAAAALGKAER